MKRLNTSIIWLSVSVLTIFSCQTNVETNDISAINTNGSSSLELVATVSLTSSQDGTTGSEDFSDVSIEITGTDANLIQNSASSSTGLVTSNNGQINLYVESSDLPSDLINNPLEFEILIKSNQTDGDIVSTGQSFVYQGDKIEQTIGVVKRSKVTSLNGIGGLTDSLNINSDGSLTQEETLTANTSGGNSSAKSTTITLPAGVQFKDADGNVLTGSAVSVKAVVFDAEESSAASFFPGGMSPNQIKMLDGTTTSGDFVSAGFIALDMYVGGSEVKEFSAPIAVKMQLSSDLGLAVGDKVPYWSFDDATGVWAEEGEAEVIEEGGNLYATMSVAHLSYWNFDFFFNVCSTRHRSIPVTLPDIESRDYTYLNLYALLTPSATSGTESKARPKLLPLKLQRNSAFIKLFNIPAQVSYDIVFYSEESIGDVRKYMSGYTDQLPTHLGVEIKDFNPCTANSLDISELKLTDVALSHCSNQSYDVPVILPSISDAPSKAVFSFVFKPVGDFSDLGSFDTRIYVVDTSTDNRIVNLINLTEPKRINYDVSIYNTVDYEGDEIILNPNNFISKVATSFNPCSGDTLDLTNLKEELQGATYEVCENYHESLTISNQDPNISLLRPIGLDNTKHIFSAIALSDVVYIPDLNKTGISKSGYELLIFPNDDTSLHAGLQLYVAGRITDLPGTPIYTSETIDLCKINYLNISDYFQNN